MRFGDQFLDEIGGRKPRGRCCNIRNSGNANTKTAPVPRTTGLRPTRSDRIPIGTKGRDYGASRRSQEGTEVAPSGTNLPRTPRFLGADEETS